MSGHSKWSTIKHKKGAADAKRGKLFSKLSRQIMVAAKEGGADASANLALQNAVEKARSYSMPKDNIDRAIAKGSGEGADGAIFETVVYEGYGPEGVAVIVEALTDNRNRTAADVRHLFSKYGGNLGATGAVAWQFERRGVMLIAADGVDEDDLVLAAAEAGADDVELDGRPVPGHVGRRAPRRGAHRARAPVAYAIESAELSMIPKVTVAIGDESTAKQVVRLVEGLEDNDDVQDVYANFDIPEDVLEAVVSLASSAAAAGPARSSAIVSPPRRLCTVRQRIPSAPATTLAVRASRDHDQRLRQCAGRATPSIDTVPDPSRTTRSTSRSSFTWSGCPSPAAQISSVALSSFGAVPQAGPRPSIELRSTDSICHPPYPVTVRVLGIDPGTAACGYGIVDEGGGRVRAVTAGCWRTTPEQRLELRLQDDLRRRRRADRRAFAPTRRARGVVRRRRCADRALGWPGARRRARRGRGGRARVHRVRARRGSSRRSAGTAGPTSGRCSGWCAPSSRSRPSPQARTKPMRSRSRSATR